MKELDFIMEECGKENIRTYIQSGNVIFRGKSEPGEQISDLNFERKGFRPELLILRFARMSLCDGFFVRLACIF